MNGKIHSTAQFEFATEAESPSAKVRRAFAKRANELDGATWTKYSISVWSDIKKSSEEVALGHPATFPVTLVQRLVQCFTTSADQLVLDPFAGSGSTLIGAMLERKHGVGFEIVPSYISLAQKRIANRHLPFDSRSHLVPTMHQEDARHLLKVLKPQTVDFCLTSPPYWDILSQKRTADNKQTRDYGDEKQDLAKIHGYWEFIKMSLGRFSTKFFEL